MGSDTFVLYDLRVEVAATSKNIVCDHKIGDYFEVCGENLSFPQGQSFSMYSLAALLPLLPAKQRKTDDNDWMTTDTDVACPDPNCGAIFRISRTGERTFHHSEVTAVPLPQRKSNDS
ncbi:MAG: TIGR04076 family protein [Spirochaetales bacterium]|nr:TIGR04076 family protein [Spirochaetales bacterium]